MTRKHKQGIKIHTERHLTCQLYMRSAVAFKFVKCCMVTRHIHCGENSFEVLTDRKTSRIL